MTNPRNEPFYFGVPLIARAAARDWSRIDELIEMTLRSVLAQDDRDFALLLAGHDLPDCWDELTRGDPRFEFIDADWPPEAPTLANDDAGSKKWRIREEVKSRGGGLLMYLDADDLVDRRLVATARRKIGPEALGGIVGKGLAIDFGTRRAVALPGEGVLDFAFHELCGSSTVGRLAPARPDPFDILGSHHLWARNARAAGAPVEMLPLWGGYLVNTLENHSENHGPFAEWRRSFGAAVVREGEPLSEELRNLLGLEASAPSRIETAELAEP